MEKEMNGRKFNKQSNDELMKKRKKKKNTCKFYDSNTMNDCC